MISSATSTFTVCRIDPNARHLVERKFKLAIGEHTRAFHALDEGTYGVCEVGHDGRHWQHGNLATLGAGETLRVNVKVADYSSAYVADPPTPVVDKVELDECVNDLMALAGSAPRRRSWWRR